MKTNWRKIASAVVLSGCLATAGNNGLRAAFGVDGNSENGGAEVAATVEDSEGTKMNDAASKPMLDKLVELAEKTVAFTPFAKFATAFRERSKFVRRRGVKTRIPSRNSLRLRRL